MSQDSEITGTGADDNLNKQEALSRQRYEFTAANKVETYSNTSEDEYGIRGAYAEMADSIEKANDYIFITGWMFHPYMHLPSYGVHLRSALDLHHQGKYQECVAAYQAIIDNHLDKDGYATFFMAYALYQQGNYLQAKNYLNRALLEHPENIQIEILLATLYLEENDLEEAEAICKKLLEKNREDPVARTLQARILGRKAELGENADENQIIAKQIFETILVEQPFNKEALLGLAKIHLEKGEISKGINCYDQALYYHPNDIASLLGLIKAFENHPKPLTEEQTNRYYYAYDEALEWFNNHHDNSSPMYADFIKKYAIAFYPKYLSEALRLNLSDPDLLILRKKLEYSDLMILLNTILMNGKNGDADTVRDDLVLIFDLENAEDVLGAEIFALLGDLVDSKNQINQTAVIQILLKLKENPPRYESDLDKLELELSKNPYDRDKRSQYIDALNKKDYLTAGLKNLILLQCWFPESVDAIEVENSLLKVKLDNLTPELLDDLKIYIKESETSGDSEKMARSYAELLMHLKYSEIVDIEASSIEQLRLETREKLNALSPSALEKNMKLAEQNIANSNFEQGLSFLKNCINQQPYNVEIMLKYSNCHLANFIKKRQAGINPPSTEDLVSALELLRSAKRIAGHDIKLENQISRQLREVISIAKDENIVREATKLLPKNDSQCEFSEAMAIYQNQIPSIGEILIKKAIENPEMVIAINLWDQYGTRGSHDRMFHPIEQLQLIADRMGVPLPENLMIRTNYTEGLLNSHHQKYMVMDDGQGSSTAYMGSVDITAAKFEWSSHQLINTKENNNVLDKAYDVAYGHENFRVASASNNETKGPVPRAGWREVVSKLSGEICESVRDEFFRRWRTREGGRIFNPIKDAWFHTQGASDENYLVSQKYKMQEKKSNSVIILSGNRNFIGRVADKIESVKLGSKSLFCNMKFEKAKNKFNLALNNKPFDRNDHEMRRLLNQYLKYAYLLCEIKKKNLERVQKKYSVGHRRIKEVEDQYKDIMLQYRAIKEKYAQLPDIEKQTVLNPNDRSDDNKSRVCLLTTTQKAYYKKEDWNIDAEKDDSILQAYLNTIKDAKQYIYIENQYFSSELDNQQGNGIARALVERIIRAHKENTNFHVYVNLPFYANGDPGGDPRGLALREYQNNTMFAMMKDIEAETGESWSKYISFNFFAQWHGVDGTDASQRLNDSAAISIGESQSLSRRAPIYNHAKLMVVDGESVINGSANINDRSLLGGSDTETAFLQVAETDEAKKSINKFMRQVMTDYYGTDVGDKIQDNLDKTGSLGLGDPDVVKMTQDHSLSNLSSYCSNLPGNKSNKKTGLVVTLPFEREKGKVGQVMSGYEYVPDAPRNEQGKIPDSYRWVSNNELTLSQQITRGIVNYSGKAR